MPYDTLKLFPVLGLPETPQSVTKYDIPPWPVCRPTFRKTSTNSSTNYSVIIVTWPLVSSAMTPWIFWRFINRCALLCSIPCVLHTTSAPRVFTWTPATRRTSNITLMRLNQSPEVKGSMKAWIIAVCAWKHEHEPGFSGGSSAGFLLVAPIEMGDPVIQ